MQALYKISGIALLGYLSWKYFLYRSFIVPWVLQNIIQLSERTSNSNANDPIAGVFVYFVLLMLGLVAYRLLETILKTYTPPSMHLSFGTLLAVPPVSPRIGIVSIIIMSLAIISFIYLLLI